MTGKFELTQLHESQVTKYCVRFSFVISHHSVSKQIRTSFNTAIMNIVLFHVFLYLKVIIFQLILVTSLKTKLSIALFIVAIKKICHDFRRH